MDTWVENMFNDTFDKIMTSLRDIKLTYLFSSKKRPDIVLTDKNDVALVIKYDSKTMFGPVVLEKGRNSYAQKIINLSRVKEIPVVEEKKLANDLYSSVEPGEPILPMYWESIAKIYGKYYDKIFNNDVKNNFFDNVFEIQRHKTQESFFIEMPEKILIELSGMIFEFIRDRLFKININGCIVQNIKIRQNPKLKDEEYCIKINGLPAKQGNIVYSMIDPFDQLSLYLTDVLKNRLIELIGRDEIAFFISQMKNEYPVLVQEVMKYSSIGEIRKVLHGLLRENVSIQNISTILEVIADFGGRGRKIGNIINAVRKAIGRDICFPYLSGDNILKVMFFEHDFEKKIKEKPAAEYVELIQRSLSDALKKINTENIKPVLICVQNRMLIKRAVEKFNREIAVISIPEIPNDIKIELLAELKMPPPD